MSIASFPSEALSLLPAGARSLRGRTGIAPWQPLLIGDIAVAATVGLIVPLTHTLAFGAILIGLLAARGCYRVRFTAQLGSLLSKLVTSVAVTAAGLAAVLPPVEALVMVRLAPFVAVLLIAARALAGAAVRSMRSSTAGRPTLIIGAGALGNRMAQTLIDHPEYGLYPVGIVDDIEDEELAIPFLGTTRELATIAERFDVGQVIVAYGKADEARMVDVLRTCERLDAEVWIVPRMFELGTTLGDSDELWGIPVSQLKRQALRTGQWRLKRAFDVVGSLVLLVLTLPVFAVVAAAVKLTSPGPLFFRQARVGQNGRVVDVLKFRSMTVNDDSDKTWNVTSDARVTWIGRIIRPTSLDELPQLLNVLRGDMSLVGPRPERPHFVELFSADVPGYTHRHRVPVGLTGLAQVNGLRGDTSIADRATFDNRYIEHWSLWGDLVILARTIGAVIRPPASIKIDAPAPTIDLREPAPGAAPAIVS